MHSNFITLAEAIEKDPSLKKIRDKIKDADVINYFYEIFSDFEKIAVPVKVEKGVISLKVENSVWRSELKFNESIIIEKINNYLKEERIKKIKFV
jgi:hypothetical protein